VQSDVEWTGDWEPQTLFPQRIPIRPGLNGFRVVDARNDGVHVVNSDRFVAGLDAVEADVFTAEQIPLKPPFNNDVVAALKPVNNGIFRGVAAVHTCVGERGEMPDLSSTSCPSSSMPR
jgi:hypothetical protein